MTALERINRDADRDAAADERRAALNNLRDAASLCGLLDDEAEELTPRDLLTIDAHLDAYGRKMNGGIWDTLHADLGRAFDVIAGGDELVMARRAMQRQPHRYEAFASRERCRWCLGHVGQSPHPAEQVEEMARAVTR